jgi:uncharacterized phiE125 gp8 family phage protein
MRKEYPSLDQITAPVSEPINIAYLIANEYLKSIDLTDTNIATLFTTDFIPTARRIAEKEMNRRLFTQTWELTFNSPPTLVKFPFGQLQSVTSVTIYNQNNSGTIENASLYAVKTGDNGQLWLNSGSVWATSPRAYNSTVIRFICGWSNIADIPKDIIKGMMTLLAWMYYNRENDNEYKNTAALFKNNKIWEI